MRDRPRLVLVDDHHLVLDGLRLALQDEYDIVGTVVTGGEAIEACRRLRPDLVLLDLSLPDRSGLEVITDLRQKNPDLRILVVTMYVDRVLADAALQSGARGFVPKDADLAELRTAIREVLAGRCFVSSLVPDRSPRLYPDRLRLGMANLTPRQRAIVGLLGDGKSSARIADELHLSCPTITFHRTRIRKALGLKTEWDLMRHALLIRMCETNSSSSQKRPAGHARPDS